MISKQSNEDIPAGVPARRTEFQQDLAKQAEFATQNPKEWQRHCRCAANGLAEACVNSQGQVFYRRP